MPLPDKRSAPRPVNVPTTFMWGDADPAIGEDAARLCSGWVDAKYEFIALRGADHWLPEAHPDDVAAAILDRIADFPPGNGSDTSPPVVGSSAQDPA